MANKITLDKVSFKREMERVEREIAALSNIEIGERIDYATETLRVVTPVDTGKARSGWSSEKQMEANKFISGKIENPVEYISVLNNGHSRQAPKYFIEQVLTKIGLLTPN